MTSWTSLLTVTHLIGLSLAVGAATVKLTLLLRSNSDSAFVPTYIAVARPITRLIVLGMVLLTLSGIGWLVLGYEFKPLLIAKLVLVAAILAMGPIIDNVVEPRFRRLAPAAGESPSAEFVRIRARYLALEVTATGLFYVIILIWVLV